MTVRGESDVAARLDTVPREYRGFAYEGASMALAILDGMLPAGGKRLDRFVTGPAAHQVYTAHVGAGWAMAPPFLGAFSCPSSLPDYTPRGYTRL